MKLFFSLFAAVLLFVFLQSCNKRGNEFKNRIFEVVSSPEEAGFDATRLQRIDTFFQTYVDKGILPNGISFVAKDGKIVHFKAYGWRDKEAGIVLKKDDIFRLASQTKAITTAGLMILLEKGLLGLDEPVSKYIPEFVNPQILVSLNEKDTSWTSRPSRSEILIRHLLNHTSGIGDYVYGINGENPQIKNPIYKSITYLETGRKRP
jgi:CubicO group peptidase (beta-lactamase class C family)